MLLLFADSIPVTVYILCFPVCDLHHNLCDSTHHHAQDILQIGGVSHLATVASDLFEDVYDPVLARIEHLDLFE